MLVSGCKICSVCQGDMYEDGGAGLEGAYTGVEVCDVVTEGSRRVHGGCLRGKWGQRGVMV
jgi:hypothetical protein